MPSPPEVGYKCISREKPTNVDVLAFLAPSVPLHTTLQGIVGTTPWLALVFITLWLQLLGFSDFSASLLVAAFLAANAAGKLAEAAL